MSNVNSVGSSLTGYLYSSLSSGSRINSASNGASELAILQKQEREVGGFRAGTRNLESGQAAMNIADGAISGITDSLQRMRELAIQAGNGTLSDSDRSYIQSEIDQLKQGISEIAERTDYNGKKLLDNEDGAVIAMASDANGTARSFGKVDATLESLGIADFDVTGDFDVAQIDQALSKVSEGRASIGASYNAFDAAIRGNNTVTYNTVSAQSRMGDTDYGDYIQKLKKQQLLTDVSLQVQKRQQEEKANRMGRFFE
ncbi:MAG: flagellin FliC5 [Lachnospiraceae bacterium]|nr:flagellin FliC5 [Lachnospiraceae bacterium]